MLSCACGLRKGDNGRDVERERERCNEKESIEIRKQIERCMVNIDMIHVNDSVLWCCLYLCSDSSHCSVENVHQQKEVPPAEGSRYSNLILHNVLHFGLAWKDLDCYCTNFCF